MDAPPLTILEMLECSRVGRERLDPRGQPWLLQTDLDPIGEVVIAHGSMNNARGLTERKQ